MSYRAEQAQELTLTIEQNCIQLRCHVTFCYAAYPKEYKKALTQCPPPVAMPTLKYFVRHVAVEGRL